MIILSSILAFIIIALLFTIGASSDRNIVLTNRINLLVATIEADNALLTSHNESIRAEHNMVMELREQLQDAQAVEHEKACLFIAKEEERIRADAITRSKNVQKGFSAEHFAPFQMEYNPRDYRHAGDPIDYLVYVGSTAIKDGTSDRIEEILFLDIKTGEADLNKTQRRIRDAVIEGRVNFATWNPDTNILRRYKDE